MLFRCYDFGIFGGKVMPQIWYQILDLFYGISYIYNLKEPLLQGSQNLKSFEICLSTQKL